MTGPHDSVIGVRTEIILGRFLTGAAGPLRAGRRRRAGAGRGAVASPHGRAASIATFTVPGY